MSAALSPDQRQRLAKLLAMLGSAHAGERDAAGLAAQRLVQQHGITWQDVLASPKIEYRQAEQADTDYAAQAARAAWRKTVKACLEHPDEMTQWETHFLRDIWHRRGLTSRQHEVLNDIAEKVLAQSRRSGGAA